MKVLVVGAGAAGLMAAGRAAELGASVVVLERNSKPGKKLYITGKGRCNVTNLCEPAKFVESIVTNPKFMLGSLSAFGPSDATEFFASLGMSTVVERGNRVFPASQKASDVTRALVRYCTQGAVEFVFDCLVEQIERTQAGFEVRCADQTFCADRVILACGGMSYPLTGSDGRGYALAQSLGHSVVPPRPALVPIHTRADVSSLRGLSLVNVTATIYRRDNMLCSQFGEMLFTDDGVSGPIILSLSSMINQLDPAQLTLAVDLKPALGLEQLDARLLREFAAAPNKQLASILPALAPRALAPWLCTQSGIDPTQRINSVSREQRHALANALKGLRFDIAKLADISVGIVTAGGVDVRQINPKTMQSRLVDGLHICGEMLDVDALTGGYNIQIALSSGFAAGTNCII